MDLHFLNITHLLMNNNIMQYIADSLNDGVEIFDASADDPPNYEAPPDYEEVIKLILSGNNLKVSKGSSLTQNTSSK